MPYLVRTAAQQAGELERHNGICGAGQQGQHPQRTILRLAVGMINHPALCPECPLLYNHIWLSGSQLSQAACTVFVVVRGETEMAGKPQAAR